MTGINTIYMDKIYFSSIDDVEDIMEFIHNNWKENHILSQNKELFLYDHKDGNRINFVVYRNSSNEIDGILGFIKSSSCLISDIWTVVWKALNNKEHPMLGIELFEFLRSSKEYGVLSSPGINQKIINIYKFLGIYTDHFRQFVLINDKITEFKIAKVSNEKYIKPVRFLTNNKYSLKKLSEKEVLFDFKDYKETIPYKDKKYFIKRYFNHPVYSYDIFGIFKNSKIHSLLVTRSVLANGSKALRIVDFIGDQKGLQFITKNLYEKIIADNYEYADFMCFGFDYEKLLSAGFQQVNLDSSDLIIPNYFSPYVAENIKINFYIDTDKVEKVRMCKADGDQDRPN